MYSAPKRSRISFNNLVQCLYLGLALAAFTGCASVGPPEQRSVRSVLQSEKIVQPGAPTRLLLKGESHWDTPDQLLVSVEQENSCSDSYREKVATTVVTTRKTKNVATEALIGAAVAAAGGVALAVMPQLSDVPSSGSETSPRENARNWGIIGAAGGGLMLGHVVWVSLASMDKSSEPVITHEVRASGEKPRPCGTSPAGPGIVLATVGNRTVDLGTFETGKEVSVRPRQKADELCGDASNQDDKAFLEYVLKADGKKRVEIGQYSLRRCVSATLAARHLRDAELALGSARDAEQVGRALRLIAEAEQLISSLPRKDPDRGNVEARIGKAKAAAADKASAVLAPLTKQALEKIATDPSGGVQIALDALAVARVANSFDETAKPIYQAYASHKKIQGVDGYIVLKKVLDGDGSTKTCVETGDGCSTLMTRERLLALLAPAFQSASDAIARVAAQVDTAAKAVAKAQNTKTVTAFDGALAAAQPAGAACVGPMTALQTTCQRLNEADLAASSVARAHESQLAKLRKEIADRQRAETLKRTTRRWRAHFAECRRLRDGARALEAISNCDANCQRVVQRMRAERQKLQSFSYPEVIDDPQVLSSLADECGAAGCESCP